MRLGARECNARRAIEPHNTSTRSTLLLYSAKRKLSQDPLPSCCDGRGTNAPLRWCWLEYVCAASRDQQGQLREKGKSLKRCLAPPCMSQQHSQSVLSLCVCVFLCPPCGMRPAACCACRGGRAGMTGRVSRSVGRPTPSLVMGKDGWQWGTIHTLGDDAGAPLGLPACTPTGSLARTILSLECELPFLAFPKQKVFPRQQRDTSASNLAIPHGGARPKNKHRTLHFVALALGACCTLRKSIPAQRGQTD